MKRIISNQCIAALVVALFSGGVFADFSGSQPAGLISWWPGEDNAYDTVGANDGILNGDFAFVPGHVGQGFYISGTGEDYVEVLNDPSLEPAELTVSAWLGADVSPGVYGYALAKGARECDTSSYGLYTGGDGGISFYVSNDAGVFVSG